MTAVEWLVEELNQKIHIIPMDKWDKIRDLVQKAKEMENKNAVLFAKEYDEYLFRGCGLPRLTAEQYYNQTFKSE